MKIISKFIRDDSGSNALEYGLIVGLVSLGVVTAATTAATNLGLMFAALGTRLATITTTIAA